MRQTFPASVLVGALLLSSCADLRQNGTLTEPRAPSGPTLQPTVTPGTCTTLDALKAQAATIFGPGSPNYNSVRGKLDNLEHQITIGNLQQARDKALEIVSFTKAKWEEGGLPGTKAQLDEFIYGVMCFAGFDLGPFDPNTSVIILTASSTETQEGYTNNADAGLVAPPGTFNAPDGTPVVITVSPALGGLQNTKLDQYPGVFNFISSVDLAGDITIGVCLTVSVDPAVFNGLRLGHDLEGGLFEVTSAAAPPPGLNCPTFSSSLDKLPRWLASVARFLLPKPLAAAVRAGGGVGGTAGKLSPFGPVDLTLSATGGSGGSAGKLSPPSLSATLGDGSRPAVVACDFPTGSAVSVACRPQVTITTRLGTVLTGVPVEFEVGSGGGTVAMEPTCSGGAGTITDYSDAAGFARACWTLGNTFGQQKVWVTPSFGGDAPEGVIFEPATLTFFANAVPEGLTTFMCELGTADGDFTTFTTNNAGKFDLGWIRVKEPANKNTVDVGFFISVTGQSSLSERYALDLRAYRNTSATIPATNQVGSASGIGTFVTVSGDNGKPAFQDIRLTSPVLAATPGAGTTNYLWFRLFVTSPAQRTFQFWHTTKLSSTTSPACTDASVLSLDLRRSKLGPAIRLKN